MVNNRPRLHRRTGKRMYQAGLVVSSFTQKSTPQTKYNTATSPHLQAMSGPADGKYTIVLDAAAHLTIGAGDVDDSEKKVVANQEMSAASPLVFVQRRRCSYYPFKSRMVRRGRGWNLSTLSGRQLVCFKRGAMWWRWSLAWLAALVGTLHLWGKTCS
ncbi:hypothetical protein OG21DRAFT_1076913 [Imleria badia]|nr:hypothetical protein OG21DRAFT_1076913 [Imleria badia]